MVISCACARVRARAVLAPFFTHSLSGLLHCTELHCPCLPKAGGGGQEQKQE